jgi:hypothetical protein
MKHTWQHSPGSKQHWLYKGSSIGASRIVGMIYEVNPTAFTVYRELTTAAWQHSNREFMAQMSTLEEAKDLLLTLINSRMGETA